jgi:transposase
MNEAMRQEIVQRRQGGMSVRAIAAELGISRGAVTRALARVQAQREGLAAPLPRPRPRQSIIDPFEPLLKELLAKYPNLTTQRALQELQARGFTGQYTVVRQRLGLLRPRAARPPVPRFETGPGLQAQMDFGVYDLDFTREGRRRVYLFSYLLGYSRRQYLRFVESMDLPTTLREHVHAFHHLGGVARVCLYDNFKAVVLRHDADGALYNPKFLAFATHYGFRPQACRVRRPQTKGKVERKFFYVETSLLNGRTFDTLEHLNEVTSRNRRGSVINANKRTCWPCRGATSTPPRSFIAT